MADLPKRKLGRTGLEVTVLGFGTLELRGSFQRPGPGLPGRPLVPTQAQGILNAVLDAGINFIDTCIDYGESEEYIGKYISHRRNEYILASKCGCIVDPASAPPGGGQHVYTRKNITAGVNQSLKRMKTDHLDLIQFHGSPSKQVLEQEGAIQTLLDLKREGKVRFIGASSTLPNVADLIKLGVFDTFQVPYSAIQREHEGVISQAAKAGAGTIIRGGVARGSPEEEGRGDPDAWKLWGRAKLDELLDGMTQMEFVLRFTITHPDLHTAIVGTLNPAHLAKNVAVVRNGPLPASVYNEAKKRLAAAGAVPVSTQ
ncbi:MAG: aldo/keto reductase [Dehalococcoidia bacterium]|nr:aldo/keto reductase [Dehalococcoidia bacterium]